MKHTPGPWRIVPVYGMSNVYRLWDKHGNFHNDTSQKRMDANASLMAAAPLLLKALRAVQKDRDEVGVVTKETVDAIGKAIAKAEGKEATR